MSKLLESRILLVVLAAAMAAFIVVSFVTKETKPRPRYTIWVGSPEFGVGYEADSFTRNQDGSVTFQKKDGTTTTVTPYEIEDKGVKP